MKIRFAYGKQGLEIPLPEGFDFEVVEARSAKPLPDVQAALDAALDRPIGRPSLTEMARGKNSAAIAVCDITRPVPNRITLSPLLRRLRDGGIPQEKISLHIATGLHRGATDEELESIL